MTTRYKQAQHLKQQVMIKYLFLFLIFSYTQRVFAQRDQKLDTIIKHAVPPYMDKRPWMKFSAGVVQDGVSHIYNFKSNDQTLFEIGSITKTFFSLLLAHAFLEGKAKPTDDIREYLNEYFSNLSYEGKPIQLIHLVNLTSSLPDNFPPGSDFMAEMRKVRLDTVPGLVARHSNVGAKLLGHILENIFHKSYPKLVKEYILDPLKMENTFFDVPANKSKYIAVGHNYNGTAMPAIPQEAAIPGGLKSSIADMTKYLNFQLEEKDSAVQMTHQPTWGNPDEFAIGMNWFISKTGDGKMMVHDDGTTFGFTSYFLLYPQVHFGVVLLMNEQDSTGNDRMGETAQQVFAKMFYTPEERASDGFNFSPSINKLLVGLNKTGFLHARPVYDDLKKADPQFALGENEMNNWGYFLLGRGKRKEALAVFKLNVDLYPESWNTYDSYGETLLANGDKELAIKMYEKSIQLNPKNENGKKVLEQINSGK